ncbi:MAG TPA: HEAT repeat domain-containing protein, partial [bacterium]|nr:HEAT repeat domain-containing protein [bacterium]
RDSDALQAVGEDARAEDEAVRLAALYALSEIGEVSSKEILAEAAETITGFHRVEATHFYLTFAQRLAEKGHTEEALAVCRDLFESKTAPDETAVQCAALHVMSQALGENAIPDLLQAMTNDKEQVRAQAMNITNSFSGNRITRGLMEFYQTAFPDLQAELIRLLARRGDNKALPLLFAGLDSSEKVVRLAAIESVSTLAGSASLNALLDVFSNEDKEEVEAAKAALTMMPGTQATADIAAGVTDPHPAIRLGSIEILVARGAKDQIQKLCLAGRDDDEDIRLAALKGLGALGDETVAADLVALLLEASSVKERKEAEKALNLVLERSKDRSSAERPIVEGIESGVSSEIRSALLTALKYVGTPKAL